MKLVFTVVIVLLYCTSVLSQSEPDSNIYSSFNLENIVVSASRASNTDPVTIQNISKTQIDRQYRGQDPVVLLQELTPSIITYSDGGTDIGNYSQFRLRGIDQSRVNITLNGVPLNDMVDHGVYFSNFSDFGNSIESIQVQRGVSSSSRGVASYAGAVNFESISLFGDEPSGEAQITLGSFGTLRTAAEVNTGKIGNDFGAYGRFTKTSTDGYKFNSGSDSYSMFFSGGRVGEKDVIKLTAFSGKTQNGQSYEHVPLDVIMEEPRANFNALNDIDDFEQQMIQLQYGYRLSKNTSFNATAYYNGAGGVFPYTFDGVQTMYGLANDHYGIMGGTELKNGNGILQLGIHAYLFDRVNYEYVAPFVNERYTQDFTDKHEVSVNAKYTRILDALKIYGSLEWRRIDMDLSGDPTYGLIWSIENDWAFINAILGAHYQLNDYSALYLSLGRSSREPTRTDILNDVSDHETVVDLEFGWRFQHPKHALSVNAFHMNFNNEIAQIGALVERSYMEIRQNVPQSLRAGIETQYSYSVNDRLRIDFTGAYMRSNIESYSSDERVFEDVEHIFAPKWIVQPSFEYSLSNRAHLQLSARYVSDSFTELSNNDSFTLPSHFITNARLRWQIIDALEIHASVQNIFDVLYFTEGSPLDLDYDGNVEGIGYRIQPPRNAYVQFRFRF